MWHDAVKNETDQRKEKAEEEGPPETAHLEPGHDGGCEEHKKRINHEYEYSEGYDGKGQGENDEDGPQDGVYKAQDERRDQRGKEVPHDYAREDIRSYDYRKSGQKPVYDDAHEELLLDRRCLTITIVVLGLESKQLFLIRDFPAAA